MEKQKLFFMFCLLFFFAGPLHAIENQQEFSNREKIRKVLMGPIMAFGVAATTAYCANKMGWGASPLAMLGSIVAYRVLHGMIARKGERYNKWHVIPAMLVGYGCGYYIGCPSAVPSIGEYLVRRTGAVDLSQNPNLRQVNIKTLVGPTYTVYVTQDATWADVKQAFVEAHELQGASYTSLSTQQLNFTVVGKQQDDKNKVFDPAEGEDDHQKVVEAFLVFRILPA